MSEIDGSWIPFFENITIDGNGVWIYEKKKNNKWLKCERDGK